MDRQALNKFIREYVKNELEKFDQDQAHGRAGNPYTVDKELMGFDYIIPDLKEALSTRRHVEHMSRDVLELYPDVEVGSDDHERLCYEALKAEICILEACRKRLLCRFNGTDENTILRTLGIDNNNGNNETVASSERAISKNTISLAKLLEQYQQSKIDSKEWVPNTVRTYQARMNTMLQFFGSETPVDRITLSECREYTKVLRLLPPSFALKGYKSVHGLTESVLKECNHSKTMDVSTQREYLIFVRSVLGYAEDSQYITKNPMIKRLIPAKKKQVRKQRVPFSSDDLEKIFDKDTFMSWVGDKPSRLFIPVMALYTGCRLEEMANLHTVDVLKIKDLHCIDMNFNNDRRLKNKNAVRSIPLHDVLIKDLKFIEYVNKVRAEGHQRVFPELTIANFKYSHHFSKWFGNYLRNKVKITDKSKTFHSFRHTFTDHLYSEHLVMESLVEEITGRAGKTQTRLTYTQGYNVDKFYEECIRKLDYKLAIDWKGLRKRFNEWT
jgi:integrase